MRKTFFGLVFLSCWLATAHCAFFPLRPGANAALSARPGHATHWTVWAESSTRKVRRHETPPAQTYIWDGNEIHLKSARNENEPFQLVIRARDRGLSNVFVQVSDLSAEQGQIPSREVTLFFEHYIEITKPSGYYYDEGRAFQIDLRPERNNVDELTQRKGFHPDALPPLTKPFHLEAGQNQPLWINVHVPAEVPAGDYTARVMVSSDQGRMSLPLRVTVWDFTLPAELHFKTSFFMIDDMFLERYSGLSPEEREEQSAAYLALLKRTYRRLAQQGFFALALNIFPATEMAEGELQVSFTDCDRLMAYLFNELDYPFLLMPIPWELSDVLSAYAAYGEALDIDRDKLAENRALLKEYLRQAIDHYAQKGWLDRVYFFGIDEPQSPEAYHEVRAWSDFVKGINPGVKVLLTEQPLPEGPEHGSLVGYVDFWSTALSVFSGVDTPFSPEDLMKAVAERKNAGEVVSWYGALMLAPMPSLNIDQPAISARIIPWMSFQYGIDSFQYWALDYWYEANPWQQPLTWNDPHGFGEFYNGEGSLVYPGNQIARFTTQADVSGFIPSIRSELLRQGHEDYQYLFLLQQLGGDPAGIVGQILTSVVKWDRDEVRMLAAREQLAKEILLKLGREVAEQEFLPIPPPSAEYLHAQESGKAFCYEQYKTDPDCLEDEDWCRAYYKLYCDRGQEPTDQEVESYIASHGR